MLIKGSFKSVGQDSPMMTFKVI